MKKISFSIFYDNISTSEFAQKSKFFEDLLKLYVQNPNDKKETGYIMNKV